MKAGMKNDLLVVEFTNLFIGIGIRNEGNGFVVTDGAGKGCSPKGILSEISALARLVSSGEEGEQQKPLAVVYTELLPNRFLQNLTMNGAVGGNSCRFVNRFVKCRVSMNTASNVFYRGL